MLDTEVPFMLYNLVPPADNVKRLKMLDILLWEGNSIPQCSED